MVRSEKEMGTNCEVEILAHALLSPITSRFRAGVEIVKPSLEHTQKHVSGRFLLGPSYFTAYIIGPSWWLNHLLSLITTV